VITKEGSIPGILYPPAAYLSFLLFSPLGMAFSIGIAAFNLHRRADEGPVTNRLDEQEPDQRT
jgi:hypothetical protein